MSEPTGWTAPGTDETGPRVTPPSPYGPPPSGPPVPQQQRPSTSTGHGTN